MIADDYQILDDFQPIRLTDDHDHDDAPGRAPR